MQTDGDLLNPYCPGDLRHILETLNKASLTNFRVNDAITGRPQIDALQKWMIPAQQFKESRTVARLYLTLKRANSQVSGAA